MDKRAILIGLMLLGGCRQSEPQQPAKPASAPESLPPTALPPKPLPPKPRPTIDPKSNAAAEDLVRGFVRLLDQGRFDDAYMLFGPNAVPRTDFGRQFTGFTRISQSAAGAQEGAAGSIYVSVPLTFFADNGKQRDATVVLRRVNDVPGSTEAQRRWHIERLDWARS